MGFSAAASSLDNVTYSASNLPSGIAIDPNTGWISGTISANSAITYGVTVTAADSGNSASATFNWIVNGSTVSFTSLGSQSNNDGDAVAFSAAATSLDSDSNSATNLPSAVGNDPGTGWISGTINANSAGTYTVTVSASDNGNSASTTFTWNVNGATITFSTLNDLTSSAGDVVGFSAAATSLDTVGYVAPNLPAGISIDPNTGWISGTIGEGASGQYLVTITGSDVNNSAASTFNWTIS